MILSLLSKDFGRKLIVRACCLAPWDNAKKYISAGDLEPDHDKGSDTHKKNCDRRHRRRSLERTLLPCFVQYEAHCAPQRRVWVSHCCASNPKGGPF